MTQAIRMVEALQRDVDFERAAARKLASEKLHLEVEVHRLRALLRDVCETESCDATCRIADGDPCEECRALMAAAEYLAAAESESAEKP